MYRAGGLRIPTSITAGHKRIFIQTASGTNSKRKHLPSGTENMSRRKQTSSLVSVVNIQPWSGEEELISEGRKQHRKMHT